MVHADGHTQQKVLIPALRRALRGRCPACGEGKVVVRYTNLVRSCPQCGWILEREPGAITGSMTSGASLSIVNDEARSYLARSDQKFDIIMARMIDTWAATGAGASRALVTFQPR